ncbi:MAG: helix-turn-helix transcriptional regulator, partial [Lachnospiraceae bacterium]|nr:helix-turn-helix transcriptional regulator [Lachnospiraceae bacterium]
VVTSLTDWLYDTGDIAYHPSGKIIPKSKKIRRIKRQNFGERLDRAMVLLDLSNSQLALLLSVDPSLVSRYRSGIYSPHDNKQLYDKLSNILYERAEKNGCLSDLAGLCRVRTEDLNADAVSYWLYEASAEDSTTLAKVLLRSLDDLDPGSVPAFKLEAPSITVSPYYCGTEGLRQAVVRFLYEAANTGGELMLYSDEPMEWMTSDRGFFALWAALMLECVKNRVRIKIIHNVNRGSDEMIDAVKGWLPLYVSGMIEPYILMRPATPPSTLFHTMFLHAGNACIRGFFPSGAGDERRYEYITDKGYLGSLEQEFGMFLSSSASPFLKTYTAAMQDEYISSRTPAKGEAIYLLTELPLFTMPHDMLEEMLSREIPDKKAREKTLDRCCEIGNDFMRNIKKHNVSIILCQSEETETNEKYVDFSPVLSDLSVRYTEAEYDAHLNNTIELAKKIKNLSFKTLSTVPFNDIEIIAMKEVVSVIRTNRPHAAFVFEHPELTNSVYDYLQMLSDSASLEYCVL